MFPIISIFAKDIGTNEIIRLANIIIKTVQHSCWEVCSNCSINEMANNCDWPGLGLVDCVLSAEILKLHQRFGD